MNILKPHPNEPHWDDPSWTEQLLEGCESSLETFSQQFFGGPNGRFHRSFSKQHQKFFEVWDDPTENKILVIAHRGWGKTSLFTYAAPAQAILFDKYKFIAPCSATSTLAVMQSENLKRELLGNLQIKQFIGNVKEGSEEFTKDGWMTPIRESGAGGQLILPRGIGQQVRGVLHGNNRLQLAICDDLETADGVRSAVQRQHTEKWFYEDLSLAVDLGGDDWRIVVVGTILGDYALVQQLREDPAWTVIEMPLCEDDGHFRSNWPAFMSDKKVKELKEQFEFKGRLAEFYMEYMNISVPPEAAVFKEDMFKYYDEGEENLSNDKDMQRCVIVDPAKTVNVSSDFTAIVGLAVDVRKRRIYVRDVINERLTPDEIYSKTFDMAKRLNCTTVGYEVTSLNEFIIQPMNSEAQRQGFHGQLIELKPKRGSGNFSHYKKGKDARIAMLAPFYRLGQVFHNRVACQELEYQLIRFDRGKHDDVADALAYVIQMMFIGDIYFSQDFGEGGEEEITRSEARQLAAMEAEDSVEYSPDVDIDYN